MKKEKRLTEWVGENASLILDSPRTEEEARRQVVERFKKACNKLATLEDLIERGELVCVDKKRKGDFVRALRSRAYWDMMVGKIRMETYDYISDIIKWFEVSHD